MTRRVIGFVLLMLLLAACGVSPAEELRRETGSLDETASRPHGFIYRDDTLDGSQQIAVEGKVADDFRYAGTVSVNNKPLYQMIVSDDAVAVKLLDPGAAQGVIAYAKSIDPVTSDALAQGKWVVDFTAAPALRVVAPSKTETGSGTAANLAANQNPIGSDPFFDAADALHYASRNIIAGGGLVLFNPDDTEYNPADDPWSGDAKLDLRNKGIRRFTLIQPPLPPRAGRGQQQRLPNAANFRKFAMYLKGGRILEIREQISIRDRKEFRRAGVGRAAKYYLELRDAALRGEVSQPMRERRMSYKVIPYTGSVISIPADAVRGILTNVIGDRGLKSLFKFKVIQRASIAGVSPEASGSPEPSGSPAASTSAVPSSSP